MASQPEPANPGPAGDPASGPDAPARTKVIYVLGAGHSGSTILGMTLGNCRGVFFAGEIARWLRYDGKPRLPGAERERFWAAVRGRVQVEPELLGRGTRSLEQSSAALRFWSWRAQRRLRRRYRQATEQLFEAIAAQAQATHVVDTSHFPRRARHLQGLGGIEMYLLYAIRDPNSVVASYARRNVRHKQTWRRSTTNAYLWLTHLLCVPVFLRHPPERRLLVRHEDFVADPEGVLAEVLARVDAPPELPDLEALDTGLAFQGNRLLRTATVALDGRPEQPVEPSPLTSLVQLPWRAVFARLRPAAAAARPADRVPGLDVPAG
jgi:hypothetical protein